MSKATVRRADDGSLSVTGSASLTDEEVQTALTFFAAATTADGFCWRCGEPLSACVLRQLDGRDAALAMLAEVTGLPYTAGPDVFELCCYRCGWAYATDANSFTEARMANPHTGEPLLAHGRD